jgi:hypothetical protein
MPHRLDHDNDVKRKPVFFFSPHRQTRTIHDWFSVGYSQPDRTACFAWAAMSMRWAVQSGTSILLLFLRRIATHEESRVGLFQHSGITMEFQNFNENHAR